jgi:signal transduction histidine kinase
VILGQDTKHIEALQSEIDALKERLEEATSVIEAIRDGNVDALVVNNDGQPQVYSIESADYTYRVLIEKFGEGALSLSEDGLILYCNEYFSTLLGMPMNKLVGTYFTEHIESPELFKKLMDNVKNGPSKGEIVINCNDRKCHTYVSLTDMRPNVAAIGAVVTDLSEKIKNEQALLEYQNQLESKVSELNRSNINLEQFIHVISHDLKEPLRKILTYTSFLAENSSATTAPERKSIDVIYSSSLRLNSLVDDLVKYAFSSIATEPTSVDLNKVLQDVIDDLELVIKENNAIVNVAALPAVNSSKVQMRQLFSNLISNAIKYSREGVRPEINITSHPHSEPGQNFLTISISDNGIGMNQKHLGKIFTIFQRLHMRDEYSGNGIGLAICKRIMENHNGRIEVASIENQGSVFNLLFPVK